jgi:signal transduction histidine kinase
MILSLYVPAVLLAAVVASAVAFFAWLHRDQPAAKPLTLFLVVTALWSVSEGVRLASPGLEASVFWLQVGLTLSSVVPLAWLATVLGHTDERAWLSRVTLAALLVEPAIFVFLVWTNGGHGLVWQAPAFVRLGGVQGLVTEWGLVFWGHAVYSYLLVTAGAALLLRTILRTSEVYRTQSTALLVAITLPMTAYALYIFGLFPPGLDPSGPAFALTGIVIGGAVLRGKLLFVTPSTREAGREEALSELEDRVFILDAEHRVVDANRSAADLLGVGLSTAVGEPLSAFLPKLAEIVTEEPGEARAEFVRELDTGRAIYDVRTTRFEGAYGTAAGRLVSLRDVTERRQREQRLDVLNRVLRHNLRNEMNVVRGNVELATDHVADPNVEARLDRVLETVATVIRRADKVGTLSRTLEVSYDEPIALGTRLEQLVDQVRSEYPEADVEADLPAVQVAAGPPVELAFEELLVNGIEHSDAETPRVSVAYDAPASTESTAVVTVSDNGPGIGDEEWEAIAAGQETPLKHGSGVGLWLVTWIVRKFGGTIAYANEESGATVTVQLPRVSVAEEAEDPAV